VVEEKLGLTNARGSSVSLDAATIDSKKIGTKSNFPTDLTTKDKKIGTKSNFPPGLTTIYSKKIGTKSNFPPDLANK